MYAGSDLSFQANADPDPVVRVRYRYICCFYLQIKHAYITKFIRYHTFHMLK
jgi:hypothetical protein